jgi:hypothetical protein
VVYSFKGVDMSQGGEVTTQQLVYGPDGKVYGNPALARAAGVNQYYRGDGTPYPTSDVGIQNPTLPPDFMPLPGNDFAPMPTPPSGGMRDLPPDFIPLPGPVVSPMPNPPSGGKGGADPYSQIMGQMSSGTDPYSRIMSQMPVRQNPYAYSPGGAIGGYDPSLYNNAFMGSNSRLNLSGLIGGGRGGSDSGGSAGVVNSGGFSGPATYGSNQSLSNGLIGAMLGLSSQPSFDVTVENAGTYAGQPSYGYGSSMTGVGNPAESEGVDAAATQSISDQNTAGDSGGYGGYSDGGGSSSFGEGQYNMGGLVDKVGGPNPAGPDDGTGMLQLGEYVIKKSSVKKYGQGLLDMINDGKIPAKKMKSLLG